VLSGASWTPRSRYVLASDRSPLLKQAKPATSSASVLSGDRSQHGQRRLLRLSELPFAKNDARETEAQVGVVWRKLQSALVELDRLGGPACALLRQREVEDRIGIVRLERQAALEASKALSSRPSAR
jgi:hypothetical protein